MPADIPVVVGKELRGAGIGSAPGPTVKDSQSGISEPEPAAHKTEDRNYVCTHADHAVSRKVKRFEVSQFFKPRKARNASLALEHQHLAPRSSSNRVQCGRNPTAASRGQRPKVRPNPSVKPSPNGGPPGPIHGYGVHFPWLGPGVPPLVPAYLER